MDAVRDWIKKSPGLGLVVAGLTAIIAFGLHKSSRDFGVFPLLVILGIAYIFYRVGSFLDYFFGIYYSADKDLSSRRGRWARKLDGARQGAARKLLEGKKDTRYRTSGLYGTAVKLFGKSDDWDDQVKPWLNLSKAARAFVIPLFLILVYDALTNWLTPPNWLVPPNWLASSLVWSILSQWLVAAIMLIISLFLYVRLRIRHMVALYELIEKANVFSFTGDQKEQKRTIICVSNVVSPVGELPIFRPEPCRVVATTEQEGIYVPRTQEFTYSKPGATDIDEVTLENGNRVLKIAQGGAATRARASENGIFVVTHAGDANSVTVLKRSNDFNSADLIQTGVSVSIYGGAKHSDTTWKLTTTEKKFVLDTTGLNFRNEYR